MPSKRLAPSSRMTEPFEDGGVVYQLKLSRKSNTGYECVVEVRPGEYHAKATGSSGGGQVMLRGPACKTPKEAALRLAKHRANALPIEKKTPRTANAGKRVCRQTHLPCPRLVRSRSAMLPQVKKPKAAKPKQEPEEEYIPAEQWPPWVVCNNSYGLWQNGIKNPPIELKFTAATVGQVTAMRYWAAQQVEEMEAQEEAATDAPEAEEEEPPPSPPPMLAVQAVAPFQVSPATMAKVAEIKAAAKKVVSE